jgi:hypothetical protein
VFSVISVVLFGFATEHEDFFLLSQLVALFFSILLIFGNSLKMNFMGLRNFLTEAWRAKYLIFPYVMEGLIHGLASNAIFLAVAWSFDPEVAALYFFADKVFQALSQVIIESERPIYLQRYLSLSSAAVADEVFGRIELRILKLGTLGLVISLGSVPYIAVINSWPQGLYVGILFNLFLLWFLKLYLLKYTSFAIVFKLPWYILLQSILQLFAVVFAFLLLTGGHSVTPTLFLIVLIQFTLQAFLVVFLKTKVRRQRQP